MIKQEALFRELGKGTVFPLYLLLGEEEAAKNEFIDSLHKLPWQSYRDLHFVDGDPITGHTNEKGELTIGKDNPSAERQSSVPMLAAANVISDIQPLAVAEAMRLAKAQESPRVVEIVIPKFKSFIVKLKLDRSLKRWKDPTAYLKDQDLKPYIVRHWVVQDSMYVVLNFPVVKD